MELTRTPFSSDSGLIKKPLLADLVFDRLLADIVGGRFLPLERLNVDELADELGVSRTPVREALTRLSWARFVEVSRNSATHVAYWDASDMRDRLETAGKLICIVAQDPRLNLATLASNLPKARFDDTDTADVQAFLNFAEVLVLEGMNRVAGYSIAELINPLRIFLSETVTQERGLDLATGKDSRRTALQAALDAAREGDAMAVECSLTHYLTELAGAVSPRTGDQTHPAPTPTTVSSEAVARSLHAV